MTGRAWVIWSRPNGETQSRVFALLVRAQTTTIGAGGFRLAGAGRLPIGRRLPTCPTWRWERNRASLVGQPILAAAGFQPALRRVRRFVYGSKSRLKRRLQA